jgi:hypothetical protein
MSIADDKTITEASGAKLTALTTREPDRLHKQSRGYLRTTAKLVGRDLQEGANLFSLPTFESDIAPRKEIISKNTGILGNTLLNLWQLNKNQEGYYRIENLTALADTLGVIPQDLKTYLIYLGGYQYPVVQTKKKFYKGKERNIMTTYSDKLFYVKFNIEIKAGEQITNDDKTGTNYANFIKDRAVLSVDIAPSQSFIEDIQGRGLGNVFATDNFTAYCLDLSDLAYKIFCFSGSNKPRYKIGFDKLIKSLNLSRQLKTNGKPRILKNIEKALNELQTTGHLTNWAFDKKAELYSWTYTNKIIRHKELLPKKEQPAGETDKTGQDRQGRPDREDRPDTPETTKEK